MLPPAPLHLLNLGWLRAARIDVAILRLDQIDPLISGNKWFKLKHHLTAARQAGAEGVISLGGAHSNHLHALAAAGKRFGFSTVGLVRGHPVQTPTVLDVQAFGMQLHWLGYAGYRARHEPDFWAPWRERYPQLHPVPEGGGGLDGALGCAEIVRQARSHLGELGWEDYDGWWLACGTGTTLAGLVLAESEGHKVYGAMVVPSDHGVTENIAPLLEMDLSLRRMALTNSSDVSYRRPLTSVSYPAPYSLFDACRGGYAKFDRFLLDFCQASERESGVPFEPIYTGKALLALKESIERGHFSPGVKLIFVHTGGLQGRRALPVAG
jgi:1-aminocyclopropane-1-carboxylate deaminase